MFSRVWRRLRAVSLIFSGTVLFAAAAWPAQRQVLKGHVPEAVASLRPVARLQGGQRLHLAIGLPLRNRESLTNLLQQLYDPASPAYHQFLKPEQFTAAFGPTEADYQALARFATAHGLSVSGAHPNRMLLEVSGSVADVEEAFHVNLRVYPHPTEPRTFYAPDVEPAMDLDVPVQTVAGLNNYRIPHPTSLHRHPAANSPDSTPNAGSGSGGSFIGLDFRAAYVRGVLLKGAGQSVGLVEFDSYYLADVTNYFNLPQSGLANTSVTLSNVVLGGLTGPPGTNNPEVALDIDMAISMAPGLSTVFVYEAPNDTAYADVILNRMATDNLSHQLSSSWSGFSDTTIEQVFQEFAAQGQSFFLASGDSGAYLYPKYPVDPPCDDPYITVVGGTTLTTSGPKGSWVSEKTWNWWSTGQGQAAGSGGFSSTYALPLYQQGISMSANQGSTNSRNLPDVSLTADNIFIIDDNGNHDFVGGTSVAAPLWAGFAALVNQQNATLGQPPLGFINPALYDIARGPNYLACFHDITTGNNTSPAVHGNYFATAGFDLCTGWGTPNGSNLITALVQPPALNLTIVNGGFETGSFYGWTLTGDAGQDNLVGSASSFRLNNHRVGQNYIHSGSYTAFLGEPNLMAHLTQTLPTFPGQPYLLSFWLLNPGIFASPPVPNQFEVSWNGTTLFDQTNLPVFSETNLQFVVSATGTNTILDFGAENDDDYFGLDDVELLAILAPVFQSASRANGVVTLQWSALSGLDYQVQYVTNLAAANWINLGGPIPATNGVVTTSDILPPDPQRFYRLVLLP